MPDLAPLPEREGLGVGARVCVLKKTFAPSDTITVAEASSLGHR
jgi:hypothetical protein